MAIYRGIGGTGDSSTGEDVFGPNSSISELNGLSGPIASPTYIRFAEDNGGHIPLQGDLSWNTQEGTLDLGLNEGHVILQIGQETHYRVTNKSGVSIPNGSLLAFSGTTGNSGKLLAELYDGTQSSKYIIGIATEDIPKGSNGYVTHFGKIRGIQTNGANYGETWLDGDEIYPSPTGGLTKVLPEAPNAKQPIAVVVNSHVSNGILFVRVGGHTSLEDDELVQLTSLADGDVLQWDAIQGRFENRPASVVAGSISDGDKGDITTSSSGTVWTIDNGAVSSAKLGGDITTAGKALLDDATAADQHTTLGLVIGTNVQAYDAQLADIAGLTPTDNTFIVGNGTNFVSEDATTARTSLGLGTIATQTANNVSITGGSITGITDLAIEDGGTGASTAATAFSNIKQAATDTVTGVVELATNAEVVTGTDTTRVVTPASMKAGLNASGTAPIYACRAWVNFNGTGTVAIRASGNVSSVTDNGGGNYTINFATAMPDVNFSAIATSNGDNSQTMNTGFKTAAAYVVSASKINVLTGDNNTDTATDCATVSVAVFR